MKNSKDKKVRKPQYNKKSWIKIVENNVLIKIPKHYERHL